MLSLNLFLYGIAAPVVGFFISRWRPRSLLLIGISTLAVATVGCAFADRLWHFYLLFGFVNAMGCAFGGWPILAPALMNWFIKRRGLVMGLGQMGAGLSFVYVVFTRFVISEVGWRSAFFVLAAVLVIFVFPLFFFLFIYDPKEKGLKAFGEMDPSHAEDPSSGKGLSQTSKMDRGSVREVLKAPKLWFLVIAFALYNGIGIYLVLAHQVKFTEDVGYSNLFGVSIFGLYGITLVIGHFSGFLSDGWGREKTLTLAASFSTAALLALLSVEDTSKPWLLYLYAICFAYGAGLFAPTMFASAADLFPGPHFGSVGGLLLTGMGAGAAVGPWLGGHLYDISGTYRVAFMVCIVCIVAACFFVWMAAPRKAARRRGIS
jgi:MFS family permease